MAGLMIYNCLLVALCVGWSHGVTPGDVQINHWFDDQIYNMTVNGVIWFKNSPLRFRKDGKEYSSARGELKGLLDKPHEGTDRLGDFATATWYLGVDDNVVALGYKVYDKKNYLILQQHFLNKTTGTSAGDKDQLISAFPGFVIDDTMKGEIGYMQYTGIFFGDNFINFGTWAPGKVKMVTGTQGGPIAFFDKKDNVVIISPFSEFMSASTQLDENANPAILDWGIMGSVEEIPEDFMSQYMIFYSSKGVNKAFQEWGALMRDYYGKDSSYREADMTINYLGFWNDNGGYYYHQTEGNKTYEQTIYDLQSYAKKEGIPYRYVQYDDWFYLRSAGEGGTGTIYWDAMPSVFPSGMRKVYENTEWLVHAHNMYWSNRTTYAKQNGGKYDFLLDVGGKALPIEERFWNDIFRYSRTWGLIVYEQDWMNTNTDNITQVRSDLTTGKSWLLQMGNAARKNGLTIQYCMGYPRHVMTALEIPVVTQARVQQDNTPGTDNWQIGYGSIFAEAMGIAPFKDNFWTSTNQPGNRYHSSEPNPALQALVATMSTGPVGPSDMIGMTNVSLLMRCCNVEGLILKPSVPFTAIDKQIQQAAFNNGIGPNGHVYTTTSSISGINFGVILATYMNSSFMLSVKDTGLDMGSENTLMTTDFYNYVNLVEFSNEKDLQISTYCTTQNFCLYYYSPQFKVGNDQVMIYGEVNKWAPMSNNRVKEIRINSVDLFLAVRGAPNEVIAFRFFRNFIEEIVKCNLGPNGVAELSFNNQMCSY